LVEGVLLLSKGMSLKEGLQASARVAGEERASYGGRRSRGRIGHQCVNSFHSYTSTEKDFYSLIGH